MIAFPAKPSSEPKLPFGIGDLVSHPVVSSGPPKKVQCYVKGCKQWLRVPRRGDRGDTCPEHGIRCHHSSSATYSYADVADNVIASPQTFKSRIVGHPFKFESWRLNLEKSEDTLSWNVFRSLEEAGLLHLIAEMVTGQPCDIEPFLFLWGICTTNDDFEPWDLLIESRKRFETNLPIERPLTEPDCGLVLPGRYLILIEAKFTSFNTLYRSGPRANASSLTLNELREIYQSPELETLDYDKASRASQIYYQLWRNTIFAEWMAKLDHPNTEPFHVNLVCSERDRASASEFSKLVRPEYGHRFQRMTWEQIYNRVAPIPAAATLTKYMEIKTAGLKPAFNIPRQEAKS